MTTLKSLKLSSVIEESNIDATLIRGVVAWHGGWAAFKDIAQDISNHGANTGISFVWYTDSVKFFRNHAPAMKEWLMEIAENGYDCTLAEMIQKWDLDCYSIDEINTALYCGKGDAVDQVFDKAVKGVTEEIAHIICNMVE